jgi:pyrroline-5-carboxylate reductase
MINRKIGIIGCGNMGEALLSRLVTVTEKSTALMVSELDASRRESLNAKYRMIIEIDNNYVAKYSDIIIIAVKPKDFDQVLKEIAPSASKEKLIISMAAGITTRYIEKAIGRDIPVIRTMSNMAASIGEAITSTSAGTSANAEHMRLAAEIFSLIGEVIDIDEKLVDAVTAVSGSGPAYFFYLAECMIEAAMSLGIKEEVAHQLVLKTALGGFKLLEASKEKPHVLRAKVTSKGGTTEAAFKVLNSKRFGTIVKAAVKEACRHSKKLAKG